LSQHPIILRRRDREANQRFLRMFAVSALAHCLILSTAALAHRPPRSRLMEKTIEVNLYAPGPAPVKELEAEKPEKKASVKKVSDTKPAQTSKSTQKSVSKVTGGISTGTKASSSPEKPEEKVSLSAADRRRMESAMDDITRSLRSEAQAREESEWNQAFQEIASNLQVRTYYEQARAIYLNAWAHPPSILEGEHSGCRMIIYVSQDGTVQGFKMVQSSGNKLLDQSVLRAVQKIRSLPPVPWPISHPPYGLRFEFKSELERKQ
jgi:TonB family protein